MATMFGDVKIFNGGDLIAHTEGGEMRFVSVREDMIDYTTATTISISFEAWPLWWNPREWARSVLKMVGSR